MAGYTIDTYERVDSVAYRLRFYYWEDGERETISETFDNEEAAEERAAELMYKYKKDGEIRGSSDEPLENLLDRWIEHKRGSVGNSTLELYQSVIRNHIKPTLGKMSLNELTVARLQGFIDRLKTDGRADGKTGGLSSSHIMEIHSVLKNCLDFAVGTNLLDNNPMEDVTPPERSDSSKGKDQTFLDESQVSDFIEEVRTSAPAPMVPPLITGVCTGMRQAEVCGLTWDNVDLENVSVQIIQQLKYSPYLGLELSDVKTEKSKRTISLPPILREVLESWKATQLDWKDKVGDDIWTSYDRADELDLTEQDFVFTDHEGNPIRPKRTYEWCQKIGQNHENLPDDLNFHALRHTHASIMVKLGTPMKTIQLRLGHSDIGVTMDRYSHKMEGMDEQACEDFDRSIREELSGNKNNEEDDDGEKDENAEQS